MPLGMPGNANMQTWMNDLKDLPALALQMKQMPPDFSKRPLDEQHMILQQMADEAKKGEAAVKSIEESAENEQKAIGDLQNSGVSVNAHGFFNLKKMGQMGQPYDPSQSMGVNPVDPMATDPNMGDTGANPFDGQITDGADLKNRLEQLGDANKAIQMLSDKFTNGQQMVSDPSNPTVSEEALGVVKDGVNRFFETDDPQQRLEEASKLFDTILPEGSKASPNTDQQAGYVPSKMETNVKPDIQSKVQETNDIVRKLAYEHAQARMKAEPQSFNLKKQAQHQSIHNVMYFGPEQNHIDAFTGNLISDWHLLERNKGFGLKVDDVLDIDFESIWRGNIMDKYSRPYRGENGEWVGGYIEGRFEVNKNVPPLNNYQMNPGQRRKPILPEYGITEARMEASRTQMNKDRGYAPADKGEPFNWKKASGELKKKVIALAEIPEIQAPKLEGDVDPNQTAPNPICKYCKGNISKLGKGKTPGVCVNCEARMPNPLMQAPNAPTVGVPQKAVPFNARLSSSGSIYFDASDQKFVVYAQAGQRRFDTYDEAEKFKLQPSMPLGDDASLEEDALKNQLHPKQREVWDCADKLGIDG